MPIVFGQPVNMVHLAGVLVGWCIVLYLTIRQHRKEQKKPVVWKMVIVVWVGLFAFNLNLPMFGQTAKLSILPLGVWILYLFFRKRSWDTYRRFAWIGFAANYLFLVITLLSGAAHQAIYDKRDPSTYLADVGKAEIIGIHPSARAAVWDPSEFASLLDTLQIGDMSDSADWYYQSKFEHEPYYQHERFPYALVGAKPSWGSGLRASVYIEMDGKGLLIAAADRSYYFRSEKPLINGEAVES